MKFSLSSINPFKYFKNPTFKSNSEKYTYTTKRYPDLKLTGLSTEHDGRKGKSVTYYAYEPPGKGQSKIYNTSLERTYSLSIKGKKLMLQRRWRLVQPQHPFASKVLGIAKRLFFGVERITGNKALAIIENANQLYRVSGPNFEATYNFDEASQDKIDLFQSSIEFYNSKLEGDRSEAEYRSLDQYV